MAFISIPQSWITSGKFVVQSLWQYVKDNFDALNSAIFGLGNANIPNGSFEIDSDSDGIPDNWTQNLYPGGSAAIDSTTQASASKSWKFTSPGGSGNGGGYGDSDYIPCNELVLVALCFSHKSSVADIHNQVVLRWYTAAKAYISETVVYDEATANPTAWTRFILGAVPPSTARFLKVRLVGAKSDDATAGNAWFDDIRIMDSGDKMIDQRLLGENNNNQTSFTDAGSFVVSVPTLSATCQVRLQFVGDLKASLITHVSHQRFRVSSTYSNDVSTPSASYVSFIHELLLPIGVSGAQTVYQQLYTEDPSSGNYVYGKKSNPIVEIEILLP